MNCRTAKGVIAAQFDQPVPYRGRGDLELHLRQCMDCRATAGQMSKTRNALRTLPSKTPPVDLTVRLRILASRELAARRSHVRARWFTSLDLAFQSALRRLAVPFAGGLCAALLLFATLVPTFTLHNKPAIQDVPTGLSTGVEVKSVAPMGFNYGDAVVDLTIDDQGRVVDYSMISEQGPGDEALRRSIENNLLFTVFTPATAFGQPMPGKIRLTFHSSRIEVRG